ncbi:MAG: hypothetical protein J6O72_00375 [Lachnospira sp.]|nr:hypothetical protein [Lachnospira sp.]
MAARTLVTGAQLSRAFEKVKIHNEPHTEVRIPAAKSEYQRPPRSMRTPASQQKIQMRKAASVIGIWYFSNSG